MKRVIERPWARRQKGGWIIGNQTLLKILKGADAVELGEVRVGVTQFSRLLKLMPHDFSRFTTNGRLEIEAMDTISKKEKDGAFRSHFRKPKHNTQFFGINKDAWLPEIIQKLVVIKPRKY